VHNLFGGNAANLPATLWARHATKMRQSATKQLGGSHEIAGDAWLKISDAI
jgi:hypothetical protein